MMSAQAIKLEMGYTEAEFRKTLKGQFIQNTAYTCKEITKKHWILILDEKEEITVNIQVSQALPRKIAMLTLPVLDTYFEFNSVSIVVQDKFMNTFFRYFHKGGG